VIFDIGNVLCYWWPEAFYDARFGETRRRAFFEAVPIHAANIAIDRGAEFDETLAGLIAAHPDYREELQLWRDEWAGTLGPVIEESVATLRALKAKGVPVYALTNYGDKTFELSLDLLPFLRELDGAFVSGRLKMMKPEPAIYAAVEQGTGIAPEGLLFTDDKIENIEAATARGWRAHHFTGWRGWAERLVAEGLLNEKEAGL
jgi:2-haloacid dehalogenase